MPGDFGPFYPIGTEPRPDDRLAHDWEYWAGRQETRLRRSLGMSRDQFNALGEMAENRYGGDDKAE